MPKHHAISRYDKNLCLKPDITTGLIFLFLLRAYVILIASIVNIKDRTGLIDLVYADRLTMSLSALAGIPAAILVYAWIKRKPGAPRHVQTLWRNGRILLAISALLSACVTFVPLWMGTAHAIAPAAWAQFVLALLVVITVYTSSYILDFFNDFPENKVSTEK